MRREIRRMKKVNRMGGLGGMWGGVGCREFRGREELSRCGRSGGEVQGMTHALVSKYYRPARKRHICFATYIEMGESDFGETGDIDKECVLYQKKCELRPN
jgi:hypothetical protein